MPGGRTAPTRPGLSSLSLIVTGECNFRCRYCYQEKDALNLAPSVAARAVDVFFPRLDADGAVLFYGGEPLLRMDTIRETVAAVTARNRRHGKAVSFSVSTNGSLLSDDTLALFNRHRFTVLLSFDGRAQDKARQPGSYSSVSGALERLLESPGIEVHTNSVFTPETVGDLSASIRDIVGRGVENAQISFATDAPWNRTALASLEVQLSDLRTYLVPWVRKTGRIPVTNFRRSDEKALFICLAGENRMALSPDGRLWGCHLFYDLHRAMKDPLSERFCFGGLDDFAVRHENIMKRVLPRYTDLRMDYFHTSRKFCGDCPDVTDCAICPADAAFSSGIVGRILDRDCRVRSLVREEKKRLWAALG